MRVLATGTSGLIGSAVVAEVARTTPDPGLPDDLERFFEAVRR